MNILTDVVIGWGAGMTVLLVGFGFHYSLRALKIPMDV
jgi:hypothetical protein